MLLYNFVPDKFGRSNLEKRQLKISFPNEVNDIFEHKPFDFGKRKIRKRWNASVDLQSKTHGFISFSEHWSSPAMWGHYAENHRGICCGFEVDENTITKINYVPELRPFNEAAISDVNVLECELDYALQTKSSIWNYEDVWRMHIKLDEQEALAKESKTQEVFFEKFSDSLKLEKIVIGVKSDLTSDYIKSVLVPSDNIEIITARPSFREYAMVPQQKRSLQK